MASPWDVLGGAIGGLLDFGSSAYAVNENQNEATRANERALYARSTAYQASTEDMKKAGLNPILAAGHGATPMSSGAQAAAAPDPRAGTAAVQGYAAAATARREGEIADEQKKRLQADTRKATAEAEGVEIDNRYRAAGHETGLEEATARIKNIAGQTDLAKKQGDKLVAEAKNVRESLTLIRQQIQEAVQRTGLTEQERIKLEAYNRDIAPIEQELLEYERNEKRRREIIEVNDQGSKEGLAESIARAAKRVLPLEEAASLMGGYFLGRGSGGSAKRISRDKDLIIGSPEWRKATQDAARRQWQQQEPQRRSYR